MLCDPIMHWSFGFEVGFPTTPCSDDDQRQVVQCVDAITATPKTKEQGLRWFSAFFPAHPPAAHFIERVGSDQPARGRHYACVEIGWRPAVIFGHSLEQHVQRIESESVC